MSRSLEEAVERFVRYPESLESHERLDIARLVQEDPTAQRLAAFYSSFYDELDATPGDSNAETPAGTPEDGGS